MAVDLKVMHAPDHSVTLTPQEIAALNEKLGDLRHNVNNQLALLTAVRELLQHKPEMATRLADSLLHSPEKISREITAFSNELEKALQLTP